MHSQLSEPPPHPPTPAASAANKETFVRFIGGSRPRHTEMKMIKASTSNTGGRFRGKKSGAIWFRLCDTNSGLISLNKSLVTCAGHTVLYL